MQCFSFTIPKSIFMLSEQTTPYIKGDRTKIKSHGLKCSTSFPQSHGLDFPS